MPLRAVAFDLDDTLSESKQPVDDGVAQLLVELARLVPVCVISGGRYEQFQTQLIARLPADPAALENLHLMPTCGTAYYLFRGGAWCQIYAHELTDDETAAAMTVLETAARDLGLWEAESHGPRIEDRGSQVTFSALGQQAPPQLKKQWDPTGMKRERLRERVQHGLPDLDVHAGGSTSIDITRRGIDKAFGIGELADRLGIDPGEILFVGDRLEPGGNDHPVLALGVRARAVADHHETARLLPEIIAEVRRSAG